MNLPAKLDWPAKPDVARYCYTDRAVKVGHRVEFGRISGISEAGRRRLVAELGGGDPDNPEQTLDVTKRIHQYHRNPRFYILSALDSGRALTRQEWQVYWHWDCPEDVADISVAHILGSGLVHNLLNRMLLQYDAARAILLPRDDEAEPAPPAMQALRRAQRSCALADKRVAKMDAAALAMTDMPDDRRALADQVREAAGNALARAAQPVVRALATQAAAVACMRGIGRAIIAEEPAAYGYGEKLASGATDHDKRRLMAQDIDIAFGNPRTFSRVAPSGEESRQAPAPHRPVDPRTRKARHFSGNDDGPPPVPKGARQTAYLSYLMHTVDSAGNLRLGSRLGNSNVGAGFDMPLTEDERPTERGLRLYAALQAYGPPDMEECRSVTACGDTYHTGHFTTDTANRRLSSSRQASEALNAEVEEDFAAFIYGRMADPG